MSFWITAVLALMAGSLCIAAAAWQLLHWHPVAAFFFALAGLLIGVAGLRLTLAQRKGNG